MGGIDLPYKRRCNPTGWGGRHRPALQKKVPPHRLGCSASACLTKEGATPQVGVGGIGLPYKRRCNPIGWGGWHQPVLQKKVQPHRLRWAASYCLTKEGATPYAGLHRYSSQYDGRRDWRFGVRVGTWNIGSVSGSGGVVCEALRKRMINVCCL